MLDYQKIHEEAFNDELKKIAGARTDVLAAVANPTNWIAGPIAGFAGLMSEPYTKKEMKKKDKQIASSLLIPGVAPYRLARRCGTALAGGPKDRKEDDE